ncbi:ImmA/IrrE family metallo-endopeptidase [Rhodobacteraceae bacterium R_SAG3]|nr:ImmA/IrrE family metallo-endopeptidase [Rhodobacteraceae bacterium R_SAG3]
MTEPYDKHPKPIPTRATKDTIHKFAEEVRAATGIKNGFDLADLVRENDGKISYKGFLDQDQTDAIVVEPDGKFHITLSSHTGALRDNFTIAHELGHLLLHWPKVKAEHGEVGMKATRRVDEGDDALRRCEWEANWFASAFLMPEALFKELYAKGIASQALGVTPAAVRVRAESLKLND